MLIQFFGFLADKAEEFIDFIVDVDLGGMKLGSFIIAGIAMSIVFAVMEKRK